MVPARTCLVTSAPLGPAQTQCETGVGVAGRYLVCQRAKQVEQALGLRHGQRDRAAVGRRGLAGFVGQDRSGVRCLLDGRQYGQSREAATAKVTWRFQAWYSLTCVWSSPMVDFESWKSSSTFHLVPAIFASPASEHIYPCGT